MTRVDRDRGVTACVTLAVPNFLTFALGRKLNVVNGNNARSENGCQVNTHKLRKVDLVSVSDGHWSLLTFNLDL